MTIATGIHRYDQPSNKWINLMNGTEVVPSPSPTNTFYTCVEVSGNDVRGYSVAQDYTFISGVFSASTVGLGRRLKFFDGGSGITAAVNSWASSGSTEPWPIMCFKSFTQSACNARMDNLTGPESWVYFQEFPKYIQNGSLTWTDYNNAYATLKTYKDAHPNGHFVHLLSCSASYQERTNGPFWPNVDLSVLDEISMDCYSNSSRSTPFTGAQIFGNLVDWYNSAQASYPNITAWGTEWGVARYVSNTVLLDPQTRANVLADHISYAKQNGLSGVTYWAVDNSDSTGDWSVDKAGDEVIVQYLVSQMNNNP